MKMLEGVKPKGNIHQKVLLRITHHDSDIKRYKEIRKLTTGEGEAYTTGCLFDYNYIKINFRLITVGLSGQKDVDADPKAI